MRRDWHLVLGYSALGAAAAFVPLWGIAVGPHRLIWAGALALVLAVTGYLLWVYRWWIDFPGGSIMRGPKGRGRVALTFDDGPNGATTEAILDVLGRRGAHATFFCVGKHAAAQPGVIRRMAAEGHTIGNHTEEHRKLAWLPAAGIAHQIDAAQQSIQSAGAAAPVYFRAPHGFKSPLLPGILRRRGMRLCAWTHCLRDFERPGANVLVDRARARLEDGAILLLHDGGGDRSHTVEALDGILAECEKRGLRAVSIAELLAPN